MSSVTTYKVTRHRFPSTFKFGVGTAAYQIEGAHNEDGKSESTWDYQSHTFPLKFKQSDNADQACDSYHKFSEDVANLKSLGVDFYKFSISWSRILPTGIPSHVNPMGLEYYRTLIKKLGESDILPVVTLYHWDLPQHLEALGGWTNPVMIDHFVNYARVCFREFGNDVKIWITLESPNLIAQYGYGDCRYAPFLDSDGVGSYLAAHNMLLAHGKVYRMYYNEFSLQQGSVGITIDCPWYEPYSTKKEDVDASERMLEMYIGWIANPIFSEEGDYPFVMRERIDANSRTQGFWDSRLPKFTTDEINLLRGATDFFGLNHFASFYVTQANTGLIPSNDNDSGAHYFVDEKWGKSARPLQRVLPWGIFNILRWITAKYSRPLIFITGNGYSAEANEDAFNDRERSGFIIDYLKEVAKAILEYNCDISAFTYFPFMDCFEWTDGFSIRSGLFRVDFSDNEFKRSAKRSAHIYKYIVSSRRVAPRFSDISTNVDRKYTADTAQPSTSKVNFDELE